MRYKEEPGPENFVRFKELTKSILSVSNEVIKKKLAEEQRKKKRRKPKS